METGRRRRDSVAATLARLRGGEALERGDAVLVGNLAGIVEWTGEAWARLTGFPLEETIAKPITHFLERAGIETELVEFVAQRFLDGHACTVELPFDTFDGRRIDAHLEVTPLRGEDGEIERFIAIASDVSDRVVEAPTDRLSTAASSHPGDARQTPIARPNATRTERHAGPRFELRAVIEEAVQPLTEEQRSAGRFDLAIARDLPPVDADRYALDAILRLLIVAATHDARDSPRFVSVLAGTLTPRRSHHSEVHPIPARATARLDLDHAFVEVHDTGPPLSMEALARIRSGDPGAAPRERLLARATELAQRIGATLHLDSTPGCGSQSLLAVPVANGARIASERGEAPLRQARYMPPFAAKT